MKKYILKMAASVLLAAVVVMPLLAAVPGYTISGKIDSLPDGIVLELLQPYGEKNAQVLAVSTVKNGGFSFKGRVEGPRMLGIRIVNEPGSYFRVMVDTGAVNVKAVAKATNDKEGKAYYIQVNAITGSRLNDEYRQKVAPYRDTLDALYQRNGKTYAGVSAKLSKARMAKDTVTYNQILQSEEYNAFAAAESDFFKKADSSFNKLIESNINSWWAPFFMLDQLSYLTKEQRPMYDGLSETAKNSFYGKLVAKELYPPSYIGKKAPGLQFVDNNNKPVAFETVAKGKKFVIVDFWASWCGPCRKSIPALKAYYSEMKEQGVEIVSVSIDAKEADWKKADDQEKMPWYSFLDRKKLADKYSVKAIPAMFVMDGKGIVLLENGSLDEVKKVIGEKI